MNPPLTMYYLRAQHTDEVIQLIQRTGWCGIVQPSEGPYISFWLDSPAQYDIDHNIVSHNQNLLVYFFWDELHGWKLTLCEGPEVIGEWKKNEENVGYPEKIVDEYGEVREYFDEEALLRTLPGGQDILEQRQTEQLHNGALLYDPRKIDNKHLETRDFLSQEALDALDQWTRGKDTKREIIHDILGCFGVDTTSWQWCLEISRILARPLPPIDVQGFGAGMSYTPSRGSLEDALHSYPESIIVNPEAFDATSPLPNALCDIPEQPAYMYASIPQVPKSSTAQAHIEHWQSHGDPHMKLYETYQQALPLRWRFLADRLLMCEMLARKHGEHWSQRQWDTIAAIEHCIPGSLPSL